MSKRSIYILSGRTALQMAPSLANAHSHIEGHEGERLLGEHVYQHAAHRLGYP